ncbi:MAG: hypothetical protein ACTS7D_01660 [Candidatus Hodgkinia cicadicola]
MGNSKWTCALRGNIIHLRVLMRKNSVTCTRLLKLVKLNFIRPKAFGRSESLMENKIGTKFNQSTGKLEEWS